MAWRVFTISCFCVLACAEARGGRGRRKWRGSRGGSAQPAPAPAVEKFEYATQIDATQWSELIERVSNESLKPLYYPFVMFHVSTCQYCQHTLPEWEMAAKMVKKSNDEGHLKGNAIPVKYFIFQCDLSPSERAICDKHPGAGLPMLKMFRDKHVLTFGKERWAKAIAQWSVHAARPVVLQIETKKDMEKYDQIGTLFMMSDAAAKDQPVLRSWMNIAFDLIEDTYFCVVPPGSEASKTMPAGKSVSVYGKDIQVLPFDGSLKNEAQLRKWVYFNRWPVIVEATTESIVQLMQSGYVIVAFAHRYTKFDHKRQIEIDTTFRAKATEMRKGGEHLFVSIDISSKENANLMSRLFGAVSIPSVFVFAGNATVKSDILYWEDPLFTNAKTLSFERLDILMADDWARHDNTTHAWAKMWGKATYRFGSGGVLGFFAVVLVPLLVILLLYCCIKELMRTDTDEDIERIRKQISRPMKSKNSKFNKPRSAQDDKVLEEIKQKLLKQDTLNGEGLRARTQAQGENKENPAAKEASKGDNVSSTDGGSKED